MDNEFHSKDGDQNVAQGDGAIGKQENAAQEARDGNIFSGTGNVTVNGISPAVFAEYAGKLAVTESALINFFKILEEQQVPSGDLDAKLREIAATHKELLARLATFQSDDPEVQRLKQAAKQAIEAGEYAKAEELLNQAEARDVQAIEELEQAARQRRISAAETNADQANLQRVQLRYAKAAEYWQKAAALLQKGEKKERSLYLHSAAFDLHRIAEYKEALHLWEQSLAIDREIGDRAGEGVTLNNIGQIYHDRGDYDQALDFWERSYAISQEIGDKKGEAVTLNNISQIYDVRGKYDTALKYLEQSLSISQEIGDKKVEGMTLSNIGLIYDVRGKYGTALKYLGQSLTISRKIFDRRGEAGTSWNIGRAYENLGELSRAEQYISRAVEIMEDIGHPKTDECRKALEELRAKRRGM